MNFLSRNFLFYCCDEWMQQGLASIHLELGEEAMERGRGGRRREK
jgi:hypothetical protein